MGLGRGGGDVGQARGSITIDTSQLAQARAAVQAFASGADTDLNKFSNSAGRAEQRVDGLGAALRGLGFALGAREAISFAVANERIATAYDRQSIAARSLAGSQAELNALMDAYEEATGGAVDNATALSDVTRLIGVGFADSVQEIEAFTRAVRGISLATGRSQDAVSTQLQIEMLNQTGLRLDQVGLSMEEVRRKADALAAANRGLTKEQAYQQAVLDTANEKYGDLTREAVAQATGVEQLTKAWKDFRLEMGQQTQGPINFVALAMANWLKQSTEDLKLLNDALVFMGQTIGLVDRRLNRFSKNGNAGTYERDRFLEGGTGPGNATPNVMASPEVGALQLDWARGVTEINRTLHSDIIDEESNYGQQRADAARNYQRSIARESEDFARQRTRQEQDLARSILEIHADASQREQRMADDLARSVGQAQTDSAERIAELRDDTNGRLIELEEDYQRDREKRARDHADKLIDAAGRLDAKAVAEAQRNFARQEKDAEDAHNEQRAKLEEQLQERLTDEAEALSKSINQRQEAYNRQLADGRAADAQRIEDMQAALVLQQAREDEDRATRLTRMAEDHNDQLAEMDRAHGERIAQIIRQAQEERTQLDAEHRAAMVEAGVKNQAWIDEQTKKEEELEELWERFFGKVAASLTGGIPPSAGGEDALPPGFAAGGTFPMPAVTSSGGNRSTSIVIVEGAIQVNAAPGQSPYDIGMEVEESMKRLLRGVVDQ